MPACPHCGATVPEGAVYCGNCGSNLNSPTTSVSVNQPQVSSQDSNPWSSSSSSSNMQVRLEKAMKRTEQLTYAAFGIGIAIIVVFIVLYVIFV